jgi:hypothetical protein
MKYLEKMIKEKEEKETIEKEKEELEQSGFKNILGGIFNFFVSLFG